MEVLKISSSDCAQLVARFRQHKNSQRRMLAALDEAGASASYARLVVLRNLEQQTGTDLGMVCHRFERRNDPDVHTLERAVMNYVAQWRLDASGAEDLWIRLDRIREVRDIVEEGKLVAEPEA